MSIIAFVEDDCISDCRTNLTGVEDGFEKDWALMIIGGPVGKGAVNDPQDVQAVETLLTHHRRWLDPMSFLQPDGVCDAGTIEMIRRFQGGPAALEASKCDGLVTPRGFTIKRLQLGFIPFPKHAVFGSMCWDRSGPGLSSGDYAAAAKTLGCESAAIQAISEQEAGKNGPWDPVFGRPTILFERHKFSHHTKHIWDLTHPDISNKKNGVYGKFSIQYSKLYRAATLDEAAALQSASWGAFQILGENYAACGYPSVAEFVDAMLKGVSKHLEAFVAFVGSNRHMKQAIQNKDWATFARRYNGPKYKENKYDTLIAERYARLTAGAHRR